MGFWGSIWNGVKSAAKWAGDKVKAGANWVKEKVSNAWNSFTGQKTFEEADELYNRISERYNARRKKFEEDVDNYTAEIEKHVTAINKHKERIRTELFPQMVEKINKICDIEITEGFNPEEFNMKNFTFDELSAKSKLYKIDFNKHPIKSNALAIVTLGFYTRKKAKETLHAVQEEEGKINHEIAKMDGEIAKLKAIEASLSNIDYYFSELTDLYNTLLVRLDSAVNFLFVRCMTVARKIVRQEMSLRYLSLTQRKEIEAIITSSKILKAMADTQIVSLTEDKNVKEYEDSLGKQHKEFVTNYNAA